MSFEGGFKAWALTAAAMVAVVQPACAQEERRDYNIGPQSLATALTEFGRQSDRDILFSTEVAAQKQSRGVSGNYTAEEALQILLVDTGLEFRATSDNTFLIEAVAAVPRDREAAIRSEEDIVVTGTNIQGARPVGSLVFSFGRDDFQRAGVSTVDQFLATVPQNFGGGANAEVSRGAFFGSGGESTVFSPAGATSLNLRGLGAGTSLVLVNGRRVANSDGQTQGPAFTDISLIPLSAVERIEIMPDGASAIYGADAIGGVVNIILRRQYTGGETQLRASATTQGGGEETLVAQSLGFGWGSGNALLSFQFQETEGVHLLDRDFLASDPVHQTQPRFIIPAETRQSILLSGEQNLTRNVSLFGDISYSSREGEENYVSPILGASFDTRENVQYGGVVGVRAELSEHLNARLTAGASYVESERVSGSELAAMFGIDAQISRHRNQIQYVEAILDGRLASIPAGPVHFALGAGYREEQDWSDEEFIGSSSYYARSPSFRRTLGHVFGELRVPLIGPGEHGAGAPRLLASLAGRYEEYSQVGDTFNPKLGLEWLVTNGVRLRASYGTSFRAPGLYQNDPDGVYLSLFDVVDPALPGGVARVVIQSGADAELAPETATTWSLGLDVTPESVPNLRVSLNYYDIDYTDRIDFPRTPNMQAFFFDPSFAPARIVRGEISDADFDALVAEALAAPVYFSSPAPNDCNAPVIPSPGDPTIGACTESPSNFDAFLFAGLRNLGASRDRGVDLTVTHRIDSGWGPFDVGLNATYLIEHSRRLTSTSPAFDLVGTTYNPPDFRARGFLAWSNSDWTITGTINYLAAYTNNTTIPDSEIPAWVTTDLNIRFDVPVRDEAGLLDNISLILDINNVFDESPTTYVEASSFTGARTYDAANSDPFGRRVALTLIKRW